MNWWKAWRLRDIAKAPEEDLEAAANTFEHVAWSAGIFLVGGGLLLEVAEAFFRWDKTIPWFDRWGAVIADAAVALGVFGEIYFSERAGACQNELRRRSNNKLADANQRLAEIQKITAWRQITPEQRESIQNAIKDKVGNLSVLVEYERTDPESWSYAMSICEIFQTIGPAKLMFGQNSLLRSVFGLMVEYSQGSAGDQVIGALRGNGVVVHHVNEGYTPGPMFHDVANPPNIRIFVCPKPPPQLEVVKTFVWRA